MNKSLVLIFSLLFISQQSVNALDIVYPSSKISNTSASSSYIFGSVKPGAALYINKEPVKIWNDNFFVHVIPLKKSENKIVIEEISKSGKKHVENYKINYLISKKKSELPAFIPNENGRLLYAKTIKDYAVIRKRATTASTRIAELPKGVVVYLSGRQGDFYKIDKNSGNDFWIHKSNLSKPFSVEKKQLAKIGKIKKDSDELYNYIRIQTTYPVPFILSQYEDKLKLVMYSTEGKNNNFEYDINIEKPVLGYDASYIDGDLVIKIAKTPEIKKNKSPLYGVRIYIDAGHGGHDKGAVGPTRVGEKEINLAIAKNLINLLRESGAIVSYTRYHDHFLGLYERVDKAKANNAFISVSIHNNSLPPGANPYITHGTEVHYYNNNALKLALIIKNNLSKDLNLKDNGIHKSSLVLTRASNPISVLIEAAYMINPDEYILMQTQEFQLKTAESIKKSLEAFILSLNKKL